MRCPECGAATRIKDTRQWRDSEKEFDWIERRRVCSSCPHRVLTMEIPKHIWNKYVEKNT